MVTESHPPRGANDHARGQRSKKHARTRPSGRVDATGDPRMPSRGLLGQTGTPGSDLRPKDAPPRASKVAKPVAPHRLPSRRPMSIDDADTAKEYLFGTASTMSASFDPRRGQTRWPTQILRWARGCRALNWNEGAGSRLGTHRGARYRPGEQDPVAEGFPCAFRRSSVNGRLPAPIATPAASGDTDIHECWAARRREENRA